MGRWIRSGVAGGKLLKELMSIMGINCRETDVRGNRWDIPQLPDTQQPQRTWPPPSVRWAAYYGTGRKNRRQVWKTRGRPWSLHGLRFPGSLEVPCERQGSVRRPSSHRIPPRACRRERACAGRSAERQLPGSNPAAPCRPPAGQEIQNRQCHRDGFGLTTSCSPFFDLVRRRGGCRRLAG